MALADVKAFFKQLQSQRDEMKADLADFENALAEGHITEDQLQSVKEDFDLVETNYQRVLYIMYLFDIPNRHSKKTKFLQANRKLIEQFSLNKSDEDALITENENVIKHFRDELKRLKDNK